MNSIYVSRNGKDTVSTITEGIDVTVNALFHKKNGSKFWKEDGVRISSPKDSFIRINWAYSGAGASSEVTYNKGGAITLSSDKARARTVLMEAGIKVPETYILGKVLDNKNYPLVARTRKHQAGQGFLVVNNDDELYDAIKAGFYYYSKLYNKEREFRVHVAHGKVLVYQEKTPVSESSRDEVIWNHANGEFTFETVSWEDYDVLICKESVAAVKALGLDYGAVDIMTSSTEENSVSITEVNTSPALSDYSGERYKKYFKWLLRSDTTREWFDSSEFTKGRSFAFKNFQLEG